MRQISEKVLRENREVHFGFIDLEKAFDKIEREHIWNILREKKLIKGIQQVYKKSIISERTKQAKSKPFEATLGVKQGSILSPLLFTLVIDEAVKTAKKK